MSINLQDRIGQLSAASGVAVGVVLPDGELLAAVAGVRRQGGPDPVSRSTMFSVQSVSKSYTAMVVLAAVERGLVELDMPIVTYLPEFTVNTRFVPRPQERITLRHLLSHTSGLTHEAAVGSNAEPSTWDFDEHVASISASWLRCEVGDHYEYSNLGVDLAGYLVARVAGERFEDLARCWVFEPLSLKRTTFDQLEVLAEPDRAQGHDPLLDGPPPVAMPMMPAGGLYSNVTDACAFVRCHLNEGWPVVEPSMYRQMTTVPGPATGQTTGYGLGLVSLRWNRRLVHGHSGGGFGCLAGYYWLPEHHLGVVVLRNDMTDIGGADPALALLDELADALGVPAGPPTPSRVGMPLPAARRRELAATYAGRFSQLRFDDDGDQLHAILGPSEGVRFPVVTRDPDGTQLAVADGALLLGADPPTGPPALLVDLSSGAVWHRNIPETLPDGFSAEPLCGRYQQLYAGQRTGTARIWTEDNRLWIELSLPGFDTGPVGLNIDEHGDAFSTTGEHLDYRTDPITYANIPLIAAVPASPNDAFELLP